MVKYSKWGKNIKGIKKYPVCLVVFQKFFIFAETNERYYEKSTFIHIVSFFMLAVSSLCHA